MSRTLVTYLVFLVALSVWVGGGVFDTISSHFAWYADPVTYIRNYAAPAGTTNPWPFTTGVLALATLASLIVFARAKVPGRREVLLANGAVLLVLVATGVYFVPVLGQLEDPAQLSDARIVSLSTTWIWLNLLRQVFLLGLLVYALVGLMRLGAPAAMADRAG